MHYYGKFYVALDSSKTLAGLVLEGGDLLKWGLRFFGSKHNLGKIYFFPLIPLT